MQLPITLRPRPSPWLALALVFAHGFAVLGAWPIDLPLALKLWYGMAVTLSLAFNLRRHVLRPGIRALTLKADGSLEVERRDGLHSDARVNPRTTVLSWLVVLQFDMAGKTSALTLPRDALTAGDHRQLRVWLRWKAASAG